MTTTASTDAELLAQARRGDETAFAELYVRHESAARRLANSYARGGDADDLVNGAFERVLQALRKGLGPTEAFRAYLFVTLRRLATDRIARTRDAPVDEVPEPVRAAEAQDDDIDPAERTLVIHAYESLPGRWQTVLWHTAVEGRPPRELAPTLGMSANAAAALAYRAREKLRQAYLQAHLQAAPRPECEPHRSRLGAYVRDGLGARDRAATGEHIDGCSSCQGLVAELADVNRLLVRSLFPIFVGVGDVAAALATTAATTALAGTGAATGTAAGGGSGALRGAADLGRRTLSRARANPAAASTVVGALLVMAVLAGALIASRDDQVALPPAPPGVRVAPGDESEPPDVPLEVTPPPRRAEPISSSSEPAPPTPTTGASPGDPDEPSPLPPSPTPTTRPPASPPATSTPPSTAPPSSPTTSTTPTPPPAPPTPPGTDPPPLSPPPTTTPPTTQPPSSGPTCHLDVQLGGLLNIWICLDATLLTPNSPGRHVVGPASGTATDAKQAVLFPTAIR
jgi:RNA polymerase sigma factor (sigma-70 family)